MFQIDHGNEQHGLIEETLSLLLEELKRTCQAFTVTFQRTIQKFNWFKKNAVMQAWEISENNCPEIN